MSTENQSATPRATTICGVEAKDVRAVAAQRLCSAQAVLRMFWQMDEAVEGVWRYGEELDGSDAPEPMDVDAVEGVRTLLLQALPLVEGLGNLDVDFYPVTKHLQPAIDLLALGTYDDGRLTPAGAWGIGSLLAAAESALSDVTSPRLKSVEAA